MKASGQDQAERDPSAHEHGPESARRRHEPATRAGAHHGRDPDRYGRLFWICLVLTIPTVVLSEGLQHILGLSGPRFPGSDYVAAALGVAIMLVGGRVFLQGAWHELRGARPGMMTLISLALLVAFGYSAGVTLGVDGMDFWWELATLVTIMLLGRWIEMRAVQGAQNALGELATFLPDTSERLRGRTPSAEESAVLNSSQPVTAGIDLALTERVPTADLAVGDLVLVRPGERIPVDGEVVDGEAEVDESLLTGESIPALKAAGDPVIAGSVAAGGALVVRVAKRGADTALAGIVDLVTEAQTTRSATQLLADRAAAILFYVAVSVGAVTFLVWWFLRPDDPAFVLERVVTVLVIACPHALGLAIPLVTQLSTAIGARRGILIRQRAALEEARNVDIVLFDKTGTLTRGELTLTRWVPAHDQDEAEILRLAAAVELRSEHPIGRAVVDAAKQRRLKLGRPKGFAILPGRGARALVEGRELSVMSGRSLVEGGLLLPSELVHETRALAAKGHSLVYLLEGDQVLALFALADTVREESAAAIRSLRRRGVRVAMLTGDSHAVAQTVAAELGITEVSAEVLPAQKAEIVARLQREGSRVAMVGDGVNDAPALATADVGIAIGAGTDVAIESAGIVLASSNPRGVVEAIALSRVSYRTMRQNLVWAAGYNVVGLPLAAGVLAGVGILVPPALGALVMSLSTIIVAVNAQSLRLMRFAR